jgi:hypothetical protein
MSDNNTGIRRWDGSASANDWALGLLVPIRLGLAPSQLGWSERSGDSTVKDKTVQVFSSFEKVGL